MSLFPPTSSLVRRDQLVCNTPILRQDEADRSEAMLFHGGGHVMFSRQQVNPKQVALFLSHGFLPVSFDYRLCPELNVLDGPMNDVCEALRIVYSRLHETGHAN